MCIYLLKKDGRCVVESLEELGETPDFKNMTMFPWENIISYSKLFTSEKNGVQFVWNNRINCYEVLVWRGGLLNI